jgi:TolB-like protein/class 3 adenylate cyclase/Tfp pilus assembly protein PilF
MPEARAQRCLAAIFAADVVGYSRLMERDEAGTFERLRAHRKDLFEPEIEKNHGRIFKLMGDGLLAEFGSVLDAVECAVALQRSMADRNVTVEQDKRIEVRIGINLGEVIIEGEDRYGEGVNIAARLQQLADSGGICVSDKVCKEVENKLAFRFEPMGEQRVKNIAQPVRAYRVRLDTKDAAKRVHISRLQFGKWRWPAAAVLAVSIVAGVSIWIVSGRAPPAAGPTLPDKPSIAVLPFANMSEDPKQDYFAEGITDDLITDLSKVSGLFVIARNSTAKYKGTSVSVAEASKDLGVRYVLEGTVQRAGEQVRINARLIDSVSGGDIWADRFDGSLADVFALQDKVTRNIADALAVKLTPAQELTIGQKETTVAAAYDSYLKGWSHFLRESPNELEKAIPYFEEAVKLDPNYGRPYAALALAYRPNTWTTFQEFRTGPVESPRRQLLQLLDAGQEYEKVYAYLKEAKKHPNSLAYQASGLFHFDNRDFLAAYEDLKQAIALDPSDSWSYADMASVLSYGGRPEEAMPYITTAMRIDPTYPPQYAFILGFAQFGMDQFEAAAKSFENAISRNSNYVEAYLLLVATYGHLGRKKEAESAIADLNRSFGQDLTIRNAATYYSPKFKESKDVDRILAGLRLAGMPPYPY